MAKQCILKLNALMIICACSFLSACKAYDYTESNRKAENRKQEKYVTIQSDSPIPTGYPGLDGTLMKQRMQGHLIN